METLVWGLCRDGFPSLREEKGILQWPSVMFIRPFPRTAEAGRESSVPCVSC